MQIKDGKISRYVQFGAMALALFFATPKAGQAQTSALNPAADPLAIIVPIDPFDPAIITDYREEMRKFIRTISEHARTVNPGFVVIAKDGLDLVDKPDLNDDTLLFPARAYMRAIDGVLETNLLDETVTTPEGKPSPDLEAALSLKKTHIATANTYGLTIMNMEYSTDSGSIDKLYVDSAQKGFVPFVAESPELTSIPKSPESIFSANPTSIHGAAELRNYLFIANSQAFGATTDYLLELRKTNYDAVVIDVFHGRKPLTRQDINLLKYKHLGSRRLVLAEIDISSASIFHYYWKAGWQQGNPPYIYAPYRTDPDRHRAVYWDAGWQSIITGNVNSYLYGIIDLGFDGVVLKGVDAWKFYETGGEVQ